MTNLTTILTLLAGTLSVSLLLLYVSYVRYRNRQLMYYRHLFPTFRGEVGCTDVVSSRYRLSFKNIYFNKNGSITKKKPNARKKKC